MAKLIVGDSIYDEVSLGKFSEAEVTNALKDKVSYIYQGFFYTPFDFLISDRYDSHKPDFALIDKSYRSWWIGEVELVHHSLEQHVLPQIRTFLNARYDDTVAKELFKKMPEIDEAKLKLLVKTEQPGVLVVVNRYKETWVETVQREGAKVGIFEIFRSDLGQFIFRVNGFVPEGNTKCISSCNVEMNMLKVNSPATIAEYNGKLMKVSYEGAVTDWTISVAADTAWMVPRGGMPLKTRQSYSLNRSSNGEFYFVENSPYREKK